MKRISSSDYGNHRVAGSHAMASGMRHAIGLGAISDHSSGQSIPPQEAWHDYREIVAVVPPGIPDRTAHRGLGP